MPPVSTPAARRDHPRVCGEHLKMHRPEAAVWGSSPRVRGTRNRTELPVAARRIIPACAGNTRPHYQHARPVRDHPRVCGEHFTGLTTGFQTLGSSPRVRGTPIVLDKQRAITGIIPACAGNTAPLYRWLAVCGDHPRVCGEHITRARRCRPSSGSSPRVRGTHGAARHAEPAPGIIPACAGNTPKVAAQAESVRDHPRVCGEHCMSILRDSSG